MTAKPPAFMPGTALRHAIAQMSQIADAIDEGDLALVLMPSSMVGNTNVTLEDADAVTDAFMRVVAALEEYQAQCTAPDAPLTVDVDRYLAAQRSGERTYVDPVPMVRWLSRLRNRMAEAAATALDEDEPVAPTSEEAHAPR